MSTFLEMEVRAHLTFFFNMDTHGYWIFSCVFNMLFHVLHIVHNVHDVVRMQTYLIAACRAQSLIGSVSTDILSALGVVVLKLMHPVEGNIARIGMNLLYAHALVCPRQPIDWSAVLVQMCLCLFEDSNDVCFETVVDVENCNLDRVIGLLSSSMFDVSFSWRCVN